MIRRSPPLLFLGAVLTVWTLGRATYAVSVGAMVPAPRDEDAPRINPANFPGFMLPIESSAARGKDYIIDIAAVQAMAALRLHKNLLPGQARVQPGAMAAAMAESARRGGDGVGDAGGARFAQLQALLTAYHLTAYRQNGGLAARLQRRGAGPIAGWPITAAPAAPWQQDARPAAFSPRPIGGDRWGLSAWVFHRDGGLAAPLPGSGSYGGSQAGARLRYRIDADGRWEAFGRLSSAGRAASAGEAAVGLAVQPVRQLPVRLVAERRQRIGGSADNGGRSAFAVYAQGGTSDVHLPGGWRLDSYGAAGVVGARRRDGFIEGSIRVGRPIVRAGGVTLNGGGGLWGGAQPGAARIDVGPSLTARIDRLSEPRLTVDFRHRIAGEASPRSGVALTLAADF